MPATMFGAVQRATVLGAFPIYGLMGAMQALYGPLLPAFRLTFHVTEAASGLLLSAHFCGAALGILLPDALESRYAAGRRLSGGAAAVLTAGYLGLGLAPAWPAALLATMLIGLGYGGLVRAFTMLIVTGFGVRNAFMLLLLNAVFGTGALAGPALLALAPPSSFRAPFLIGAALMSVLLPLALLIPAPPPVAHRIQAGRALPRPASPLLWFMVLFFVLGGMEASLGGWEATQLIAQGASAATAATFTALFWGTFTVGRVLVAPLSLRIPPQRIVTAALLAVILLAALARLPALAPLAYTLAGFCLAPLYPLSLIWFDRVQRSSGGAPSWVMISDLVGGAVLPFLVGQLIALTAPDSVASGLGACAVVSCAIAVVLRRLATRAR